MSSVLSEYKFPVLLRRVFWKKNPWNLYKNKVIKAMMWDSSSTTLLIFKSWECTRLFGASFLWQLPMKLPSCSLRISKKNSCEKRSNKNTFRNRFFFSFFGVFFRFRKGEFHGQGALVLLSAEKTSIGGLFNKSGSKQNAQNESSRWKYGVLLKKFSRINWWSFGSLQKTMYCFLVKYRSL